MSSRKLSFDNPSAAQSEGAAKPASTDLQQGPDAAAEVPDVSIVDDDENDRLFTERILMRSAGFRWVGSHASAQEALVAIAISAPHAVLMDIRMPGMSGIECTRRLKAVLPSLIIVMVTGLDDSQSIDEALDAGGEDYLIKPFSASQLLAMLTVCFSRRRQKPFDTRQEGIHSAEAWPLSARQRAIADLVSTGHRNKEIAGMMHVSIAVVQSQLKKIFIKVHASNRVEMVNRLHAGRSG